MLHYNIVTVFKHSLADIPAPNVPSLVTKCTKLITIHNNRLGK